MTNFPEISPVQKFSHDGDLYICAMGFEDRGLDSNKKLLESNFKTKHTLCIKYTHYVKENEQDKKKLNEIWNKFSDNVEYIDYDSNDRLDEIDKINKKLNSIISHKNHIFINISNLQTYLEIWLVNYAIDNFDSTHIIYTPAEKYADQTQPEHFTSGIDEIFTMSEFSGVILPGYSSFLISFLGYDFNRAKSIYDHVEPYKKIGILPTEILNSNFGAIYDKHVYNYNLNIGEYIYEKYSIFDFKGIINKLNDIRTDNIDNTNMTIALNGSKLHALFALLFVKKYSDVQLLMSSPLQYHPPKFSSGALNTYEMILDKKWVEDFCSRVIK